MQTLEEIKRQEQDKGYASLTEGQKEVFNKTPLVFTSNEGKNITQKNETIVDETQQRILDNKAEQDKLAKEAADKKAKDDGKAAETKVLTENIATGEGSIPGSAGKDPKTGLDMPIRGQWVTNTNPKSPNYGINQFFPEGSIITFDVPEPEENIELDKKKTDIEAEQARLKISQDTIIQAYIDSITQKYVQLIEQQKEINRRAYARVETAGIRSGSARYAPEIQSGFLSAEESAGLAKISALESQKMTLIAEAQQARQDKDVELLDKKIEDYNARRKEQFELIKEQKKLADAKAEKQKEELEKTKIGDAVYNAIKAGSKDVQDIYANLRNLGMSVTPKEVEDIMNSFIPQKSKDTSKNAYEFGKDDVGKLISVGLTGEEIQGVQDIFNKYGLYLPIPELENKSLADSLSKEQLTLFKEILYPQPKNNVEKGIESDFSNMAQGLRVARMAFGTGRALSDKDRDFGVELYNKGAAEGLNVYQIVDKTFGLVINDPKDIPLAEGLRNTLLNIDGQKGMSDYDFEGLARLINSGNNMEAVRKVENQAIVKAQSLVGISDFIAEADVKYVQDKVKDIKGLLGEGVIDEVGAFTGSFDRWLSTKFGFGQANKIKAKVTSLTADLVNRRAGSNVTETEWKRLVSPNIPQMNDSGTAFKDKLDELFSDVLTRYNSERIMVSLPQLNWRHIENPEARIGLYSNIDPNPLDVPEENNPLDLNLNQ